MQNEGPWKDHRAHDEGAVIRNLPGYSVDVKLTLMLSAFQTNNNL